MTPTNEEQVGKGIQLLTRGLKPFVIRQLTDFFGEAWKEAFPPPTLPRPRSWQRENDAYLTLSC